MQNNTYGIYEILGLGLTLFIAALIIVAFVVNVWLPLKKERDYIKMEIERSEDTEKEYWQNNLKELYINSIPIYRTVYRKYLNR